MPEAAKARGRKGADSQKQNLKVRGVHSVFTAQRYQKWLKTGVVARPKQIDLLHPKEMVKNQPEKNTASGEHVLSILCTK